MVSASVVVKLENLEEYFAEVVSVTERVGIYEDLIPGNLTSHACLGLRLVDWLVFALAFGSAYDNEGRSMAA